jgi:large subunit ribosomal protein L21
MYAIVEIAGLQYRVEKDQQLLVNRLPVAEGETISLDRILLLANNDTIEIGAPVINGSIIEAKVLKHLKGDKVIVFKKKRRKGYKKKNGHRQYLSKIEITSIGGESKAKSPAKKSATPKAKKAENGDESMGVEA